MELYLDTSTPTCILRLGQREYRWEADRALASGLHRFIWNSLQSQGKTWRDIKKIIYKHRGGSFTGLRIGAAILNCLALELNIPLYTAEGASVPVLLPVYDRPANITIPKK